MSLTIEDLTSYIDENVYHSKLYDNESNENKEKAMNQAMNTLVVYMNDVFPSKEDIPIDDLSQQVLWLLKIDDSFQRAEMGVTSISIDGTSIQFREMDRSISPFVLRKHNKSTIRKVKSGMYHLPESDTFRLWSDLL